jgi:hypothetical protein
MSEVKTTRLLNYEVGQNIWKNVFPNQVWQDYYKWIRYGFVDVAYEYVFKNFEEYTVEFPFVVKTKTLVKEVWKFDLKLPVKKINYGTKFTIPAGTTTFYFADNFKLPVNTLRRVVYELLRLFSKIVIASDLTELRLQFGVLSEIPITTRPTELRFEVYDANGYLLTTAKINELQLDLLLNLNGKVDVFANVYEVYYNYCSLTSWTRFEDGKWQLCNTWTKAVFFTYVNGYLLATAKINKLELNSTLNLDLLVIAKTNELQLHLPLNLNGQVVVSANVYDIYNNCFFLTSWTRFEDGIWQLYNTWIYTNLCGLTSWDRFENREWQSCDTWT